ncbi:MAG TPA: carboxypeptidase regulatory-like domain-containing protein [Kofleriaceae bacterium]|nr:carboxypeptidase regulatory-like domain-containing protein [Kofleriaceae bacterium]
MSDVRNARRWQLATATLLFATTTLAACGGGDSPPTDPQPPRAPAISDGSWFNDDDATVARKPRVLYPAKRGESAPLGEIMTQQTAQHGAPRVMPDLQPPVNRQRRTAAAGDTVDPVLQDHPGAVNAPAPSLSFEGLSNTDNATTIGGRVHPPDVNGDVGPNHYVQSVNLIIGVWDKAGNPLIAPAPGSTPWTGFGGPCETHNDGDPIVIYDQLADRWVFSQFAVFTPEGGHQCFAVSQTPDPLGPYYLYDYLVSPGGALNDYPKISVWPDGYYMTVNEFDASLNFAGVFTAAVDRQSMVMGLPAAMVRFDVRSPVPGEELFALLNAHLEGRVPPPAGAPNYLVQAYDDETWSASPDPASDHYKLWAFHVDWADPENLSTLTGPTNLAAPEFDANLCNFGRSCIPQPGAGGLDSLSTMTMYRLAYRNLGTHEAMVVSHTTDVGADRAGVRWAELRDPSSVPTLHQTGTYAPGDGNSRWMSSIAMDGRGNIAVGYSISSTTTFPGLRYAARLAGDPLGELSQGEAVIVDGTVSQTTANRWGDYYTMSVDESDDCTFWFTGEYMNAASPGDWRTRIASFQMPLCTATEIGTLEGDVTDADGDPLVGARVATGAFSAVTDAAGHYRLLVPAGTYDVTASAFGYLPQTAEDIVVADDAVVTVDFALDPAPMVAVEGYVYDGSAHGWPLYAEITFTAPGTTPISAFTDPDSGWYSIELPSGTDFTMRVDAQVPGYESETRPITPGPSDVLAHFGLEVEGGTCRALGYAKSTSVLLSEGFNAGVPPAGWTVTNTTTGCIGNPEWNGLDPALRGNLTGGTGGFAIADSDQCGSSVNMATVLTSPVLNLSGFGPDDGLAISFNQDLFTLPSTEARIEIWNGIEWVEVATQRSDSRGPRRVTFGTTAANGRTDARVRFVYTSGWDWWWQIDDVSFSRTSCDARVGGLVFGNVDDRNTDLPVNGASVTSGTEPPVLTFATPRDPAQADGFYIAFMTAPGRLQASAPGYVAVNRMVVPRVNGTRHVQPLRLRAGRVHVAPGSVAIRVPFLGSATATLTLTNDGSAPATVELSEMLGVPSNRPVGGPFAPPLRRLGPKALHDRNARGLYFPAPPPGGRTLNAGEMVRVIPTGLVYPWGIGWEADESSAWVGNLLAAGGDDHLHEYTIDGVKTGATIDVTSYGTVFGADLAYDSRHGTLWQVNVGGDDCIHEVDAQSRAVTGATICPAFGTSERGLAYDPVTDTFYAGSWNDARIVQFDRAGNILRSVQTQLNISGLGYNPRTGHLFVLTSDAAAAPDIVVLDADLAVIGNFELMNGGTPLFGDYGQAGLELDCAGNLIAVDQLTRSLYVARTGEPGGCSTDVEWLSVTPTMVTVPAGGSRTVTVAVNATNLAPGLYQAQLVVETNTPYDVPAVGVSAMVAFIDVPAGSRGDGEIHGLAGAGITYGCGGGNFCPNGLQSRRVFAVWGMRSAFGSTYVPPRAMGIPFDDVAPDSFGSDYIEDAAARGLFRSCGTRLFCPESVVQRGEAAVTLLRLLEGPEYAPPPATGRFTDVGAAQAPFVEEIARRGIIDACGATTFCPSGGSNRTDHAIWLVRAFGFETLSL